MGMRKNLKRCLTDLFEKSLHIMVPCGIKQSNKSGFQKRGDYKDHPSYRSWRLIDSIQDESGQTINILEVVMAELLHVTKIHALVFWKGHVLKIPINFLISTLQLQIWTKLAFCAVQYILLVWFSSRPFLILCIVSWISTLEKKWKYTEPNLSFFFCLA